MGLIKDMGKAILPVLCFLAILFVGCALAASLSRLHSGAAFLAVGALVLAIFVAGRVEKRVG